MRGYFLMLLLGLSYFIGPCAWGFMSETALNSIKDAAYIQTGAANFVGQCQNYAQTTFKKQIEKWQIAGIVYPVIAVQQTIKNKEINFEVGREKIHLHPNSVQVEIPL